MDHVDKTLKLWRSVPFKWGGSVPYVPGSGDCLLSVAEYAMPIIGFDCAADFRGAYADRSTALRIVQENGGTVKLIDRSGLSRTNTPLRGDVVCFKSGESEIAGICTGGFVAARLENGVKEMNIRFLHVIAAWSVQGDQ